MRRVVAIAGVPAVEVAKFRSQFFILLEKASIQYQRAQQKLVNVGRGIGYTVRGAGEIVHARKYYWPELWGGTAELVALTKGGIEKIKPHVSVFLEKAAVVGKRARQSLAKAGIAAGYKARSLGQAIHARKYFWPELRRGGAATIAVMRVGIAKSRAHLAVLAESTSVHLRQACQALASNRQKVQKVLASRKDDLDAARAAAMLATNRGIKKVAAQIYMPVEYGTRSVQRAGHKIVRAVREIASKPRRAREARQTRENDLRNLLATSPDAIVVTDTERRFFAVNTKALQLFGVSNANIRNFTLDSFIANGQISGFNEHGASFGSNELKKGNCKIRRLDGNVRLAEYEFTANHLPSRHLCIFRNVTPKPVRSIARTDTVHLQKQEASEDGRQP